MTCINIGPENTTIVGNQNQSEVPESKALNWIHIHSYLFHTTNINLCVVIPAKAANLTVLEKTSYSAVIQWSVVFPMQNFPPGVMQKVEYQSEWDNRDTWQVVNTSSLNPKNATHVLNITGLEYANSLYDIRVFMKSPYAIGEHMWSQPASVNIRTRPTSEYSIE